MGWQKLKFDANYTEEDHLGACGAGGLKRVFGLVDIYWLAEDIHFFGDCPLFGLDDEVVRT
jgi:hypothetical protein